MKEKKNIINVLKRKKHSFVFLFLLKCFFRSKKLFQQTSWATQNDLETKFSKRLALPATIYLELKKQYNNQEAYNIMKEIIIPIGLEEMNCLINDIQDREPMERLLQFFVLIRRKGVGKFVNRRIIKANDEILHYEVKNCIFVRFFKEIGTPELANLFCKVDEFFFPKISQDSIFIEVHLLKILKRLGKSIVLLFSKNENDN